MLLVNTSSRRINLIWAFLKDRSWDNFVFTVHRAGSHRRVAQFHGKLQPTLPECDFSLTTDREECEGLLPVHRCHAFQSIEPSPADVHPTLHLRLPKYGAGQCDGDNIVLLLGAIPLLGAPEEWRLYIVGKGLMGSPSYSSIVSFQASLPWQYLKDTFLSSHQKTLV